MRMSASAMSAVSSVSTSGVLVIMHAALARRLTIDVIDAHTEVGEQTRLHAACRTARRGSCRSPCRARCPSLRSTCAICSARERDVGAIEAHVVPLSDRRFDRVAAACASPRRRTRAHDRPLTAVTVRATCDSAAPTPTPSVIGTPASASAISTPPSAPASVSAFVSPRCPMRNTLPASFAKPGAQRDVVALEGDVDHAAPHRSPRAPRRR